MSIVSSTIVTNRNYGQSSQRKIREEHVDHLGNPPYSKQYIRDTDFVEKPAGWSAILPATAGVTTVIPTSLTGFSYVCTTSGITDLIEPVIWPIVEGSTLLDGTVVWTAIVSAYEEAVLAASAITVNQQTIDSEIASAIATYESGGDPLHFEASPNNWQKITPDFQAWDELASAVTINFLERIDQLDLVFIESTIIRISSQDKTDLWGMSVPEVSSVNSAIQDAVNTKAVLDAYNPFFVGGVKV